MGQVRLLGIAAPPMDRRAGMSARLAVAAQQRLAGLVTNRWVRLEYDSPVRNNRRRSAYVLLETGVFVNELMVREGLARVVERGGLARIAELKRAQAEAQAAGRGVWGGC